LAKRTASSLNSLVYVFFLVDMMENWLIRQSIHSLSSVQCLRGKASCTPLGMF
jgi:hypothetical protein